VNIVTANLFQKYRNAVDYAHVELRELENDLRSIGLFRSKARNIKSCCQRLIEAHDGEVPRTMESLLELGGVGRKTANVVLGNAFNVNVGIVVDTHVARLSARLGFVRSSTPEKIEGELQKLVPKAHWTLFSHWIIWHGRRRCFARNPACHACEVRHLCPSAPKAVVAVAARSGDAGLDNTRMNSEPWNIDNHAT
jgi:endonuclease III